MNRTKHASTREHDRSLRARCAATLGMLVALMCGAPDGLRAQELVTPATLPDLVAEAEWIVVADLAGMQARRNARGNLIVTDLRFRPVHTLSGLTPRTEFVLTQGGGTLAGETHRISDTAEMNVGSRYLLFVRPGRGEMFAPFVGGAQGAYLLSPDGSATSLAGTRERTDRDRLIAQVAALVEARGAQPPRDPARDRTPSGPYPAKRYLPAALTPPVLPMSRAVSASIDAAAGPVANDVGDRAIAEPASMAMSGPGLDYRYEHRINPPAVINAFPHDWTPWHPEEEYQMASWNQYGGDVFRVYTTPTGDWAWENDRFDLAGWPSNDDMIAQFGEGWGATTLGITWSRWFDDGPIVESDTALNPAYCWTLDERAATDAADGCWGFRQTMKHELGHAWGLQHPWETQDVWWDSIMNYSPKNYRFQHLFADDTNAVRAAFAGPAIHDALIGLYTTADGTSQNAVYTPTQQFQLPGMRHGTDLSAWIGNQFKIENLGTDEILSPTVQFFLSQQRMTWDAGYAYLGSGSYISVPVFGTYTYWMPTLPIPASTPTGTYYLAAYLPDADANMGNNSAWADQGILVGVENNPTTLVPETYWQASEVGSLGPTGRWTFSFTGEVGTTYYLSLCPDTGGWADFDTTLSISYFGTPVAYDDDTCDLQSQVVFVAPYSATFTITVASFQDEYQGTFQLGYRRDISDVLFDDGFDG